MGQHQIRKSTLAILGMVALISTACGSGHNRDRVNVDETIDQFLNESLPPEQRLATIDEGEGAGFSDINELELWMEDVVDTVKTAHYVLTRDTHNNESNVIDGALDGQISGEKTFKTGQHEGDVTPSLTQSSLIYDHYIHDYEDIQLDGDSIRLEKRSYFDNALFPDRTEKDLVATLSVSDGNRVSGYGAKVAIDLSEDTDDPNRYLGEALIQSHGNQYVCSFRRDNSWATLFDDSIPRAVCEEVIE